MKKFLNIFFVTLGVVFFILILISAYLFITDPFNIKPLFFSADSEETAVTDEVDKHPLLNEGQEATLETFGINPEEVPTEISPEQEACFELKLGEMRVAEIKAGDSPTATEFFKARDCI